MNIIPPPEARGTFELLTPFTTQAGAIYTCIAVREFKDIENQHVSVWDRYYSPAGLTAEQYQSDLAEGAMLVTLFSDDAPTIYVPTTYIKSYPDVSAIAFGQKILSLNLGALPDRLPLDDLVQKMSSLASDTIGVEATVTIHNVALSDSVSATQAAAFEKARQAKIKNRTTERAQLVAANQTIANLQTQLNTLEQIVVSNAK